MVKKKFKIEAAKDTISDRVVHAINADERITFYAYHGYMMSAPNQRFLVQYTYIYVHYYRLLLLKDLLLISSEISVLVYSMYHSL